MSELKTRYGDEKDIQYAKQVAKWTVESGTMLPKTTGELVDLFKENNSVLVFDEDGSLVSHAAITFTYSDGSVEIGCVITDKEKRKNGAATYAVKQVLLLADKKYPGSKKFALANEYSSTLFKKIGAVEIPTTDLSAEVWIPCKTCPRIPKQQEGCAFKCCDTPFDLSKIK